jgi:NitT/TauT family transport system ATP-binding protein
MGPSIEFKKVGKQLGTVELFTDLNFCAKPGEITVLVGPNGCGKSTMLNMVAGLTQPDHGVCAIGEMRPFGLSYQFQQYHTSLIPWKTNFENVVFPLRLQKKSEDYIQTKWKEWLTICPLDIPWGGYPYQLSGGQQQILAFARALIINPQVLLLDEPCSSLDYEYTLLLRHLIQQYAIKHSPTIILITHTIEEAVHLGQRIHILSQKPTTLITTVDNPLPYPRNSTIFQSTPFQHCAEAVTNAFVRTTQHL